MLNYKNIVLLMALLISVVVSPYVSKLLMSGYLDYYANHASEHPNLALKKASFERLEFLDFFNLWKLVLSMTGVFLSILFHKEFGYMPFPSFFTETAEFINAVFDMTNSPATEFFAVFCVIQWVVLLIVWNTSYNILSSLFIIEPKTDVSSA